MSQQHGIHNQAFPGAHTAAALPAPSALGQGNNKKNLPSMETKTVTGYVTAEEPQLHAIIDIHTRTGSAYQVGT